MITDMYEVALHDHLAAAAAEEHYSGVSRGDATAPPSLVSTLAGLAADALGRLARDMQAQTSIPAAPDQAARDALHAYDEERVRRHGGWPEGPCSDLSCCPALDPHYVSRAAAAKDVEVSRTMAAGALERLAERVEVPDPRAWTAALTQARHTRSGATVGEIAAWRDAWHAYAEAAA